ncbi:hypothetical protein WN55_11415 [Dufourea novaeangliae]|uniref:Uncharacterized protein n=1 Tax=Dufourea novaeangliae TaxID=178035 RepID=A0A154PAS5_DUFNO|nr:hypothetical protein WN55_11415 [Dufourea novaeangliae]
MVIRPGLLYEFENRTLRTIAMGTSQQRNPHPLCEKKLECIYHQRLYQPTTHKVLRLYQEYCLSTVLCHNTTEQNYLAQREVNQHYT